MTDSAPMRKDSPRSNALTSYAGALTNWLSYSVVIEASCNCARWVSPETQKCADSKRLTHAACRHSAWLRHSWGFPGRKGALSAASLSPASVFAKTRVPQRRAPVSAPCMRIHPLGAGATRFCDDYVSSSYVRRMCGRNITATREKRIRLSRCEGGLTGRCGRSVEFLTRLLCVTHPHCAAVPVLRNALQTTAWLPYHSTYWIIPV